MTKIALIDKAPNRTDFVMHFKNEFEFDHYHLCSEQKKKILKRDVDIEIDLDEYDWIILVGSEALQNFTREKSITEYSGKLLNDKYLPIINPAMLTFKPEARRTWDESLETVMGYIKGKIKPVQIDDKNFFGLTNKEEIMGWLVDALEAPTGYISCDCETTGLFPRDGHVLGISLAYCRDHGVYILSDSIDEDVEYEMQKLFDKKKVIFHNAKFDLAMLEYHFGFKFPRIEDTMLMHYMLNENPGTHGLKQLALKHTKYGNYERELEDFIAGYCKRNGVLKAQFTWDMVPFDIMQVYAAMDAAVTFELYELMDEAIHKNLKLVRVYRDILLPGMLFLKDCQDAGVPFDRKRLEIAQNLMEKEIQEAIERAEMQMIINGIVAVGDICNTTDTLLQKQKANLYYYNFIETFQVHEDMIEQTIKDALQIRNEFRQAKMKATIVPHSPFSVPPNLTEEIANTFDGKAAQGSQWLAKHAFENHDEKMTVCR